MAPVAAYLTARVKSALSSDTFILVPANSINSDVPPKERQLTLAYVQAPRLSTNDLYSFEAREVVRKLLVGKSIRFKIHYTLPGLGDTKREFGDIKTPIFDSLIEYLLVKGAVKVKETDNPVDEEYYNDLLALQDKAQAEKVGLWNYKNKPTVSHELMFDEIESSKVTPTNAIVEKVISGDRLFLRLLIDKQRHVLAPVLIAGIRAPRSSSSNSNESEPFGNEAKYFVEKKLLLKDIKVSIIGESANGVLIGNIIYPGGNIAEQILEMGYAEVVDWQSSVVGAKDMSILRASERLSKIAGKGIWKNQKIAQTPKTTSSKNTPYTVGAILDVTVAKIVSADTIIIRTKEGEQEYTVQLSSLRGPKNSDPQQVSFVPFAKEFLRKRLIGKPVKITVDGVRPKSDQFDERPLVSITLNDGSDFSEQIVRAGWANVIRHRRGDENKSANWDVLIEAEKTALNKKAGMNGKLPPAEKIVDASETAGRAKTFLSTFINRSKIPAVVDYVSAPHRLRLILPKEGIKLVLVLGGLISKQSKESGLSKAALDYVNKKTLQRDVTIDVYNIDKTGAFIGNLYLPGQSLPLQINLLTQGFYEIHDFSIDQNKFADQFWEAQENSQKQKLGIWKNFEAEKEELKTLTKSVEEVSLADQYYDIEINDVSDDGLLSFQIIDNNSDKLIPFMKEFHEFHMNQPIKADAKLKLGSVAYPRTLAHTPKKGDLVSAAFSSNGKYYRAKILDFDKITKKYKVMHIDFGNIDYVTSSSFRQLPSQFSLEKLPAQGHIAKLSLIKLPPSKPTNYLDDAIDFLCDIVLNKKTIALANRKNTEPGVEMSFTLYDTEKVNANPTYSVNRELVENGWAIVNKKLNPWEKLMQKEYDVLIKLENQAKSKRLGCWEFGDIEEDDI